MAQIFDLEAQGGRLDVGAENKPSLWKNLKVDGRAGVEDDLEDLLELRPGLLNFGDYDSDARYNDEVLVIGRQLIDSNGKRADLLGVHRDGSLAVIEVKRDAKDSASRTEKLEFQALRYSVTCGKLSPDQVIGLYANYLADKEAAGAPAGATRAHWRAVAVERLNEHLAEGDAAGTEEEIASYVDPSQKLKIYVAAAGYEPEALEVFYDLKEHGYDVLVFVFEPRVMGGKTKLSRERVIPPIGLEDFGGGVYTVDGGRTRPGRSRSSGPRNPSDKPRELRWSDRGNSESVVSWRALLERVAERALSEGLAPSDLSSTNWWSDSGKSGMRRGVEIAPSGPGGPRTWVDMNASSEAVMGRVDEILTRWKPGIELRVDTQNASHVFPRDPSASRSQDGGEAASPPANGGGAS